MTILHLHNALHSPHRKRDLLQEHTARISRHARIAGYAVGFICLVLLLAIVAGSV
jgi:hypothetical protein